MVQVFDIREAFHLGQQVLCHALVRLERGRLWYAPVSDLEELIPCALVPARNTLVDLAGRVSIGCWPKIIGFGEW